RVRLAQTPRETDVIDDADDLHPVPVVTRSAEALADRALVRPEAARHRFIDDHHCGPVVGVGGREEAALKQPDPERLEVARADRLEEDFRPLPLRRLRLAFDDDAPAAVKAPDRLRGGECDLPDAGQRAETLFQPLQKGTTLG